MAEGGEGSRDFPQRLAANLSASFAAAGTKITYEEEVSIVAATPNRRWPARLAAAQRRRLSRDLGLSGCGHHLERVAHGRVLVLAPAVQVVSRSQIVSHGRADAGNRERSEQIRTCLIPGTARPSTPSCSAWRMTSSFSATAIRSGRGTGRSSKKTSPSRIWPSTNSATESSGIASWPASAAKIPRPIPTSSCTSGRPGNSSNVDVVALPHTDWAFSMLRQFLFDAYESIHVPALLTSNYRPIAEAATKIKQEEVYHLYHTRAWVQRLGLGTDESRRRMQTALDQLWSPFQQLFAPGAGRIAARRRGHHARSAAGSRQMERDGGAVSRIVRARRA